MVIEVNDSNFSEIVESEKGKIVLHVYTPSSLAWTFGSECLEARANRTDYKVAKLNVEVAPITAKKHGFNSMVPCFLFFHNQKLYERMADSMDKRAIDGFFSRVQWK